jgi:hypothetical protein
MTTSLSRRLNIVFLKFEIISFFIIMLFSRLYVRLGILLKCGNHLHNRIISLRGEACERKTSLAPPFLIEVPVPSQENERSYT